MSEKNKRTYICMGTKVETLTTTFTVEAEGENDAVILAYEAAHGDHPEIHVVWKSHPNSDIDLNVIPASGEIVWAEDNEKGAAGWARVTTNNEGEKR